MAFELPRAKVLG